MRASMSPMVIHFGIHRQDLFLDVLASTGLVFLQHLGFKLPFPVTRDGYFHIAEASAQGFTAVAIAAVGCVFVFVVVLAVAQLVIQFCFQAVFHKFGGGFFEQVLDVIHVADVGHL